MKPQEAATLQEVEYKGLGFRLIVVMPIHGQRKNIGSRLRREKEKLPVEVTVPMSKTCLLSSSLCLLCRLAIITFCHCLCTFG